MATTAIVGEKVGMSQKWVDDRIVPVTVLRVEPMRVVQVKTPERDGYSALQVTYGRRDAKRLTKPEAGHFAKASIDPGKRLRRAAVGIRRRVPGRPGDRRRHRRHRVEGRRHGGQPRQGLRRDDEAAQLQGPGRQPRQPQAPPGARRDRLVRLPRPRVQGHADVRPDGQRAGHDAEPRGRGVRSGAQPAAPQGVGSRAQRRSRRRPQRRQEPGQGGADGRDHPQVVCRQGRRARRARRCRVRHPPQRGRDAPGRHGAAGRPAGRDAQHEDPQRSPRRRSQAVSPEGHGQRPPGVDELAAVHRRRRSPSVRSPARTPNGPRRR